MLSDDVFRARLQATVEGLRYYVPSIADVAHCEEYSDHGFWKLAVQPFTAGACPVELILHATQRYDILAGSESFEDCQIVSLDHFLPILDAVAEGRVKQLTYFSIATGSEIARETQIACSFGSWRDGSGDLAALARDGVRVETRHFLPYRR
jgi:hypothetical protein